MTPEEPTESRGRQPEPDARAGMLTDEGLSDGRGVLSGWALSGLGPEPRLLLISANAIRAADPRVAPRGYFALESARERARCSSNCDGQQITQLL